MLGLALLFTGDLAQAKVIMFNDASGVRWQISFLDKYDFQFVVTVPGPANRTTIGKLTDNSAHDDFSPEVLTFTQIGQAPNDTVTNGLRLLFETNIINATLTPWAAFKMTLVDLDLSRFAGLADTAHPPEAHFHTQNGATYSPFAGFVAPGATGGGCAARVARDVACNMLVTDGFNNVGPLEAFSVRNLLLHEREFSVADFMGEGLNGDPRRNFQLILQPLAVPEPGAFALTALGLLLMGIQRWRRGDSETAGG